MIRPLTVSAALWVLSVAAFYFSRPLHELPPPPAPRPAPPRAPAFSEPVSPPEGPGCEAFTDAPLDVLRAPLRRAAREIRDLLEATRWEDAEEVFARRLRAGERSPAGFSDAENTLRRVTRALPLATFADWAFHRGEAALPRLFLGFAELEAGYARRGTGTIDTVPEADRLAFQAHLVRSRGHLEEAIRRAPGSVLARLGLLEILRYIGGHAEATRVFEEVTALDPDSFEAHQVYLSMAQPRWGGNHELMFRRAQAMVARRPENPHFLWLLLGCYSDVEAMSRWPGGDPALAGFTRRPEVRAEIDALQARFSRRFPEGGVVEYHRARFERALGYEAEAYRWFVRSARAGHRYSAFLVADLFARGRGVRKDPALARDWLCYATRL